MNEISKKLESTPYKSPKVKKRRETLEEKINYQAQVRLAVNKKPTRNNISKMIDNVMSNRSKLNDYSNLSTEFPKHANLGLDPLS